MDRIEPESSIGTTHSPSKLPSFTFLSTKQSLDDSEVNIEDLVYQLKISKLSYSKLELSLEQYILLRLSLDRKRLWLENKTLAEKLKRVHQENSTLQEDINTLRVATPTGTLNEEINFLRTELNKLQMICKDQGILLAESMKKLLCIQSENEKLQRVKQNKPILHIERFSIDCPSIYTEEYSGKLEDDESDDSWKTKRRRKLTLKGELAAVYQEELSEKNRDLESLYLHKIEQIEKKLKILDSALTVAPKAVPKIVGRIDNQILNRHRQRMIDISFRK